MSHTANCRICGKEIKLKLMPGVESSGLWCNHCGVNYANPHNSFPDIPEGLISLKQGWNWLWEMGNQSYVITNYFEAILASMGTELSFQLSKYYPNIFSSDWIKTK